ncbi:MAG: extracellular solute-binding protein [Micromonosporaceae bacterium]|nr:extracellular solute-binding protein [Micromonosporaceae bacterium]
MTPHEYGRATQRLAQDQLPRRSVLRLGAVGAAGIGLGALAACGRSAAGNSDTVTRQAGESASDYLQRLYQAAQKEGTAVLYTPSQESEVQALQAAWKKQFPKVTLSVTAGSTDEILQRALVEGRSRKTKCDGYQGSMAELTSLKSAGLLETYRPAQEENSDPTMVDTTQPWSVDFELAFIVAYNKNKVPDPSVLPKTFDGFTDPQWKGNIAMDLDATEFVTGLIANMGLDKATALLKGFRSNGVKLIAGSSTRTEQLADGQFAVQLDGYAHTIVKYVKKGSPIGVPQPQLQPVTSVLGLMAVTKGAPHPNAARLITEFALTADAQQAYAAQNKAGARKGFSSVYSQVLGGVQPTPLGPTANYDQARQVIKQTLVEA